MLSNEDEVKSIIYTVSEIIKAEKLSVLTEIITNAEIQIEHTEYDNWNRGTDYYSVYINVDVETFVKIRDEIQNIEATILEKFNFVTRHYENERISNVKIIPKAQAKIDWSKGDKAYQKRNDVKMNRQPGYLVREHADKDPDEHGDHKRLDIPDLF